MSKNERAAHARLLRRAIDRSGLSARQYAKQVLTRNERTIRRWLARDYPIPRAVIEKLEQEEPHV